MNERLARRKIVGVKILDVGYNNTLTIPIITDNK